MRATRDLLRRRCHFMRRRAELLTHTQNTASQYLLPTFDKELADKGNRTDVAERCVDPEVRKSIETNLALLDHDDRLLTDLELHLTQTAKVHDVNAFYRLRSVPGIGKILALVLLYEIHDIHRFPRVQDFVSSCRLVKCAKESDDKPDGDSGQKIGHAHLQWAFSEAAVLCLRGNPAAQRYVARLATQHGKAKALTILAPKLARAIYSMLRREHAFDPNTFFHDPSTGAPSLGTEVTTSAPLEPEGRQTGRQGPAHVSHAAPTAEDNRGPDKG